VIKSYQKLFKQKSKYYGVHSVWNNEELPDQWKESITVPLHKKSDKTDCNNYRGISLLSTPYKILTNILLSRLSPYIDEIIGDHQCGFRRNRLTTDQIFCICQEKKWEYNETVHHLFIDFKKAYGFREEGSIVQYSHKACSTHEISQAG
jgi:hypothetical protein